MLPLTQCSRLTRADLLCFRASARTDKAWRGLGFTLVELMVVVAIISILVAAVVPTIANIRRRSLASALGNDLRVFAATFDTYAHETGTWPAEVDAGVLPPEVASRMNSNAWLRPTPIGGQYNWDAGQMHAGVKYRAAIAVSSTGVSPLVENADLLQTIDRVIDDGNLSSGNFRLGADNEPVFIVAP